MDTNAHGSRGNEATRDVDALRGEGFVFAPAEDDIVPWKMDKPRELYGMLLSAEPFTGKNGERIMRLTIEDLQGLRWSIIAPVILRRLFAERWMAHCIDIGKPIAIAYDGEKDLPNGSKMKLFRMKPDLPATVIRARVENAVAEVVKREFGQATVKEKTASATPAGADEIPF